MLANHPPYLAVPHTHGGVAVAKTGAAGTETDETETGRTYMSRAHCLFKNDNGSHTELPLQAARQIPNALLLLPCKLLLSSA